MTPFLFSLALSALVLERLASHWHCHDLATTLSVTAVGLALVAAMVA